MYDPKCEELARYFLQDSALEDADERLTPPDLPWPYTRDDPNGIDEMADDREPEMTPRDMVKVAAIVVALLVLVGWLM